MFKFPDMKSCAITDGGVQIAAGTEPQQQSEPGGAALARTFLSAAATLNNQLLMQSISIPPYCSGSDQESATIYK